MNIEIRDKLIYFSHYDQVLYLSQKYSIAIKY